MAERIFIESDPEVTLSDMIADYQRKADAKLNPADPERLMIDCMAYRETIIRGRMEFLMRQNFVQYASGSSLDDWGELLGVDRATGESDDSYRVRIINGAHGTLGTKAAYEARIMLLPTISDITIQRKFENPTLPAGTVELIPLITAEVDGMTIGNPHNQDTENAIIASINADNFGVLGVRFVFTHATPIAVNGSIEVRPILGYNKAELLESINRNINKYFASVSLKFDNKFGVFDLERVIIATNGVMSISDMSFPNVPTQQTGHYYTKGAITINIL